MERFSGTPIFNAVPIPEAQMGIPIPAGMGKFWKNILPAGDYTNVRDHSCFL